MSISGTAVDADETDGSDLTDLRSRYNESAAAREAGGPPDGFEPTLQCAAVSRVDLRDSPVQVELSVPPGPPSEPSPSSSARPHTSPVTTGRPPKLEVTRLREVSFPSLLEPAATEWDTSSVSPFGLRGQHLRPGGNGEQDPGGVGRFSLNPVDGSMQWNADLFTILGYPTTETPSAEALFAHIHASDMRLFGPSLSSAQARLIRFARSQRTMVDLRVDLPTGQRRRVTLKAQLSPVEDGSLRVVGVVVDTTERALVEQQLLRQQHAQTLSALVGGIAHEFNNPMQAIVNFGHLIATTAEDPVLADFAGEILEAAERVTAIMRGVLDFARLEQRPAQPLSLCAVVEGSLALTQTTLRRDNIIIESDIPSDLPFVTGDQNELQQVVINLITNSRAALNERFPRPTAQKVLRLTAREVQRGTEDWVELEIVDHGIGIPADLQLRVFEPFVTTKRNVDGAGLGLAICRSIIERHGGTIHVESDGESYTAVTLSLPKRGSGSPLESLRPSHPPEA